MEKERILTIVVSIITIIKSQIILFLGTLLYILGTAMSASAEGSNEELGLIRFMIALPYFFYLVGGIALFFQKKGARRVIIVLTILELIIYALNIWSFRNASVGVVTFLSVVAIINIFILVILLSKGVKGLFYKP